jgi:hypothetical protein
MQNVWFSLGPPAGHSRKNWPFIRKDWLPPSASAKLSPIDIVDKNSISEIVSYAYRRTRRCLNLLRF